MVPRSAFTGLLSVTWMVSSLSAVPSSTIVMGMLFVVCPGSKTNCPGFSV